MPLLNSSKVPPPPLQVAVVALPPMVPDKLTDAVLVGTVWSGPAFTVAGALTVTAAFPDSVPAEQPVESVSAVTV